MWVRFLDGALLIFPLPKKNDVLYFLGMLVSDKRFSSCGGLVPPAGSLLPCLKESCECFLRYKSLGQNSACSWLMRPCILSVLLCNKLSHVCALSSLNSCQNSLSRRFFSFAYIISHAYFCAGEIVTSLVKCSNSFL